MPIRPRLESEISNMQAARVAHLPAAAPRPVQAEQRRLLIRNMEKHDLVNYD